MTSARVRGGVCPGCRSTGPVALAPPSPTPRRSVASLPPDRPAQLPLCHPPLPPCAGARALLWWGGMPPTVGPSWGCFRNGGGGQQKPSPVFFWYPTGGQPTANTLALWWLKFGLTGWFLGVMYGGVCLENGGPLGAGAGTAGGGCALKVVCRGGGLGMTGSMAEPHLALTSLPGGHSYGATVGRPGARPSYPGFTEAWVQQVGGGGAWEHAMVNK